MVDDMEKDTPGGCNSVSSSLTEGSTMMHKKFPVNIGRGLHTYLAGKVRRRAVDTIYGCSWCLRRFSIQVLRKSTTLDRTVRIIQRSHGRIRQTGRKVLCFLIGNGDVEYIYIYIYIYTRRICFSFCYIPGLVSPAHNPLRCLRTQHSALELHPGAPNKQDGSDAPKLHKSFLYATQKRSIGPSSEDTVARKRPRFPIATQRYRPYH